MKKFLENVTLTVLLSSLLAVMAMNYLVNDDITKSFLTPQLLQTDILKVDVAPKDKDIYIRVDLKRPASCENVLKTLKIEKMQIEGRTFAPFCIVVKENYVTIIISQVTEI